MQRRRRRAWSPEERDVLDRFVQAIKDGEYDALARATRACLSALEEVRVPGAPARDRWTVYGYLQRKTRSSRFHSANSFWTGEEQAVVDRYVKALFAGRYRTALKAAEACEKELTRLPTRPVVPRTRQAIFIRIVEGARAAGRNSHRIHWSRAELRIVERHAQALARGRFRDGGAAAAACHAQIRQLVPQHPARTRVAVRRKLEDRAQELGWSWPETRFLPRERALLDEYTRRAATGKGVSLKSLVNECHARIVKVYEHLASSRTSARVGYEPPDRTAVESYIERRAPRLGRRLMSRWRADEDAVVDRHALALLNGKYEDAHTAARACTEELARLRTSWRKSDSRRYARVLSRTGEAVHTRICELARTHGRGWPCSLWTGPELKVMRSWIPWYRKHRRSRAFPALKTAAEGIQEEIERLGCRRSFEACYGRFQKEWSQLGEDSGDSR